MAPFNKITIFLILSLLFVCARSQFSPFILTPIKPQYYTPTIFYYRAANNNYMLAQGNDTNVYIYAYNSLGYLDIVQTIDNPTNKNNFGNLIAVGLDTFIVSGGIGKLYTYYCDLDCSPQRIISLPADSDPTSLIVDSQLPFLFYAAYSDYNYNGPAVIGIDCNDATNCTVSFVIQDFVSDCFNSEYNYECFNYDYVGLNIQLSAFYTVIAMGFPEANNGRGVVMIYYCPIFPCVFVKQIQNPFDFSGGQIQPNVHFGASVSMTYSGENIFLLTIGAPGATTNNIYDQYVSNLYTGGAYRYICGEPFECILNNVYDITNFFENNICDYYNQNYGTSISSISNYDEDLISFNLISTPAACNNTGALWLYTCFDEYYYSEENCYPLSYIENPLIQTDNNFGQSVSLTNNAYTLFANSDHRGIFGYVNPGVKIKNNISHLLSPTDEKYKPIYLEKYIMIANKIIDKFNSKQALRVSQPTR